MSLRRQGHGAQERKMVLTLDGGRPPLLLGKSRGKEGMCVCSYKPFYRSGTKIQYSCLRDSIFYVNENNILSEKPWQEWSGDLWRALREEVERSEQKQKVGLLSWAQDLNYMVLETRTLRCVYISQDKKLFSNNITLLRGVTTGPLNPSKWAFQSLEDFAPHLQPGLGLGGLWSCLL